MLLPTVARSSSSLSTGAPRTAPSRASAPRIESPERYLTHGNVLLVAVFLTAGVKSWRQTHYRRARLTETHIAAILTQTLASPPAVL